MSKIKKFILVVLFLAPIPLIIIFSQIWRRHLPLISPLELIETLAPLPIFKKSDKIVYGFLPYWNMKYADELNIKYLTHLAYFGIDLNLDGTVTRLTNPRELDPGWNKLNSPIFDTLHRQLKLINKKTTLVVKAMTRPQIEAILNNPNVQNVAINSIMEIVTTKNFDGINIDFESTGTYSSTTKTNFAKFIDTLSTQCKMLNVQCEISVDIFADSAIKDRLYDLSLLKNKADYFIVMAYDFYRPSSNQAGPIAPLRGKCTTENYCLDYDVTASIADITKIIPPQKIILGIPFYGYQWQTVDDTFLSHTYPKTGALATYKRVQSLLTSDQISSRSASWSSSTQSPYLIFSENDKLYQIHYEDSLSISLKMDLVNQANLRGIAIWALGYEIPYNDLWQSVASKLTH